MAAGTACPTTLTHAPCSPAGMLVALGDRHAGCPHHLPPFLPWHGLIQDLYLFAIFTTWHAAPSPATLQHLFLIGTPHAGTQHKHCSTRAPMRDTVHAGRHFRCGTAYAGIALPCAALRCRRRPLRIASTRFHSLLHSTAALLRFPSHAHTTPYLQARRCMPHTPYTTPSAYAPALGVTPACSARHNAKVYCRMRVNTTGINNGSNRQDAALRHTPLRLSRRRYSI